METESQVKYTEKSNLEQGRNNDTDIQMIKRYIFHTNYINQI